MAGHSKFKNIMHRKGAQDKKRSAAFSKLSREITVAAKSGMPDPDMNPRLRLAVNNARAASMPKDNIQRAIDKASANEGDDYEELTGPIDLILVLPQTLGGLVLAYTRTRLGLIAAMVQHALFNAVLTAVG